jgi:hypothetical protein
MTLNRTDTRISKYKSINNTALVQQVDKSAGAETSKFLKVLKVIIFVWCVFGDADIFLCGVCLAGSFPWCRRTEVLCWVGLEQQIMLGYNNGHHKSCFRCRTNLH